MLYVVMKSLRLLFISVQILTILATGLFKFNFLRCVGNRKFKFFKNKDAAWRFEWRLIPFLMEVSSNCRAGILMI